jgi:hypothetical protein
VDGELTLRVVCVKWGDKYSPEYVTTLKSMVDRYLTIPHTFECVTEAPVDGVTCMPLLCPYEGWWQKIGLFRPGFLTGPTLYLDLDVVIVGSLDWVADYAACDLAAAVDWGAPLMAGPKYPNEIAGCLMVMSGRGVTDKIYTRFSPSDIARLAPHGDQTYITEVFGNRYTEIPHGRVMSYKRHCRARGAPPPGSSVIAFHGKPDPHEVGDEWVKLSWR